MAYVFSALVAINIIAFGYFTFLYKPAPTQTLIEAQASLSKPIGFTNSTAQVPPLIGTKK